jgi:hypothetical protein
MPFLAEVPRERVLNHEEIRRVFEAIRQEPRITAAWWVLLFLTAARDKSEVLRMENARSTEAGTPGSSRVRRRRQSARLFSRCRTGAWR